MKTSSSRLDPLISAIAAVFTCASLLRMLPLLSITTPIDTGTSSRLKLRISCRTLFSNTSIQIGIRRGILDGVLVADIARHLMRDLLHLRQILRKEDLAAGGLRQRLQCPLCALRLATLLLAQQADAIDQHLALLRRL